MINVCTKCIKLNPLHLRKCAYCGAECELVEDERLKTFLIEFNERKQNKEKEKEIKNSKKEDQNASI